jgi:ethanolamine utilization protein EutN
MRLGRICGNVVATVKAAGLVRYKLLVVRDVDAAAPLGVGGADGDYVAVDLIGAGDGDIVLVVHGSAARIDHGAGAVPTDAAVVAIVDSVLVGAKTTFSKS